MAVLGSHEGGSGASGVRDRVRSSLEYGYLTNYSSQNILCIAEDTLYIYLSNVRVISLLVRFHPNLFTAIAVL